MIALHAFLLHQALPASRTVFRIRDDVGTYQELPQRQSTERATVAVGGLGPTAEPGLMGCGAWSGPGSTTLPWLGIAGLPSLHGTDVGTRRVGSREESPALAQAELLYADWPDGFVHGWFYSPEIDNRRPSLESKAQVVVRVAGGVAGEIVRKQPGLGIDDRPLVPIPGRPASPWYRCLHAERSGHLSWLEDSPRPTDKTHRLTSK